jgi:hypothetical protein
VLAMAKVRHIDRTKNNSHLTFGWLTMNRNRQDKLPRNAMNLARRARSLERVNGDGVYNLTLYIKDGNWALRVGEAGKVEQLGGASCVYKTR